jgi:hypothetical protein
MRLKLSIWDRTRPTTRTYRNESFGGHYTSGTDLGPPIKNMNLFYISHKMLHNLNLKE